MDPLLQCRVGHQGIIHHPLGLAIRCRVKANGLSIGLQKPIEYLYPKEGAQLDEVAAPRSGVRVHRISSWVLWVVKHVGCCISIEVHNPQLIAHNNIVGP